jgi:hypothetical protein
MRDPAEIRKSVTGDIRKLNRRLVAVAIALDTDSRKNPVARTAPGRIVTSLYRKAVKTSQGIQFLKSERLIEEAWILLRVLLETHVNFLYFLSNDPKLMCERYADAIILDKLKHLREVNFYEGTPLASLLSRDKWEALEKDIRGRYSANEFKALRRNGFSGLSFEDRAKAIGLKEVYESCYRIASRSVHMFDPAETSISLHYGFGGREGEQRELLRLRREQLERNQNMLLGRMSYVIAQFTRNSFREAELMLLGLGYEKYCDRISGSEGDETADPPGTFRIWRL